MMSHGLDTEMVRINTEAAKHTFKATCLRPSIGRFTLPESGFGSGRADEEASSLHQRSSEKQTFGFVQWSKEPQTEEATLDSFAFD